MDRVDRLIISLVLLLTPLQPGHTQLPADPLNQMPDGYGTLGAAEASQGQVVVTGVVPNEAAKTRLLQQLRRIYGPAGVIDDITIGDVVAPPDWSRDVERMLVPGIRQVSRGQLVINGNRIRISGDIDSDASRQELVRGMAGALDPSYSLNNALTVRASQQGRVDDALANRIIEFESGSARLTRGGLALLDELLPVLGEMDERTVEIIGHTDNRGPRAANHALSAARAEAVKVYLLSRGITEQRLISLGAGEQRPIASNETPDGRARNRRIEFRVRRK